MSDVIQIHMQSFEVCCAVCAQPCSKGYGVPMYEGLLVSTSWTGPWAGMPACFECYGKHGRGELETFDDSIDPPAVEVERAADVEAFVRTLADDLSAAAPDGVRWAIVVQTGPEEPVRVAVHNAGSAGGVEELVRRLGIAMADPAAADGHQAEPASVVAPAAPFARVGDGVHWFDAIGSVWVQVPDDWMDYHAHGDVRVTLRPAANISAPPPAVPRDATEVERWKSEAAAAVADALLEDSAGRKHRQLWTCNQYGDTEECMDRDDLISVIAANLPARKGEG